MKLINEMNLLSLQIPKADLSNPCGAATEPARISLKRLREFLPAAFPLSRSISAIPAPFAESTPTKWSIGAKHTNTA